MGGTGTGTGTGDDGGGGGEPDAGGNGYADGDGVNPGDRGGAADAVAFGDAGGGAYAGDSGTTPPIARPRDVYASGGTACVADPSTVRALDGSYSGNLLRMKLRELTLVALGLSFVACEGRTASQLTIAVDGNGTTRPPAGSYTYASGTTVEVTAIPANGAQFTGWSGAATGAANPANVVADGEQKLIARFSGGSGGSGSSGGSSDAGSGGSSSSSSSGSGGSSSGSSSDAGSGGSSGGSSSSSGGDAGEVEPLPPNTVRSPNGRVGVELSTTGGVLRYRITVDGKQILAPSEIGLRSDGISIGQEAALGAFTIKSVDEQYPFFGAQALAVNKANEASVPATSGSESFTVDVHVADDGVGIRLRLAAKKGRKIEGEQSAWRFDGNPTVWVAQHEPAYEQHYRSKTLSSLGTASYDMPLTAKVDNLYVSITEAAVKDYGDMALKGGSGGLLQGHLYADQGGWTTDAAVVQPWRVTIIANDLTALNNSTLVQSLNAPRDPSLDGADWIKPGRSSWQWMAIGAPQFSDQQQWVDWTQQLGFEYYLIDEGWSSWPNAWQSLQSVVTYAKSKGVEVWLWVHSNEVTNASARQSYFKKASDIGIVGVKIDFPPACNRSVATWYWDTARDAAKQKLLLDFHGAAKPSGMERTWPNVLTREGVRGHEWHMTRYNRVLEAAHDTIVPFTRYLAGAGDYTPTVFATKELQGNTWAHELAQPIAFLSPFLCYGGHPRDYVANAAADVLKAIPAVWDESRVLPGTELGKVAAFARRSGKNWFVGILNGADARTVDLPLSFLGSGTWQSIRLGDVAGKADAWDRQEGSVSASATLQVKLSSRGGFVAWFKQ